MYISISFYLWLTFSIWFNLSKDYSSWQEIQGLKQILLFPWEVQKTKVLFPRDHEGSYHPYRGKSPNYPSLNLWSKMCHSDPACKLQLIYTAQLQLFISCKNQRIK